MTVSLPSFHGKRYRVDDIEPAEVPAPPVWTGSVGAKSLAATGRGRFPGTRRTG